MFKRIFHHYATGKVYQGKSKSRVLITISGYAIVCPGGSILGSIALAHYAGCRFLRRYRALKRLKRKRRISRLGGLEIKLKK